jgi:hypothetical protein
MKVLTPSGLRPAVPVEFVTMRAGVRMCVQVKLFATFAALEDPSVFAHALSAAVPTIAMFSVSHAVQSDLSRISGQPKSTEQKATVCKCPDIRENYKALTASGTVRGRQAATRSAGTDMRRASDQKQPESTSQP